MWRGLLARNTSLSSGGHAKLLLRIIRKTQESWDDHPQTTLLLCGGRTAVDQKGARLIQRWLGQWLVKKARTKADENMTGLLCYHGGP